MYQVCIKYVSSMYYINNTLNNTLNKAFKNTCNMTHQKNQRYFLMPVSLFFLNTKQL